MRAFAHKIRRGALAQLEIRRPSSWSWTRHRPAKEICECFGFTNDLTPAEVLAAEREAILTEDSDPDTSPRQSVLSEDFLHVAYGVINNPHLSRLENVSFL